MLGARRSLGQPATNQGRGNREQGNNRNKKPFVAGKSGSAGFFDVNQCNRLVSTRTEERLELADYAVVRNRVLCGGYFGCCAWVYATCHATAGTSCSFRQSGNQSVGCTLLQCSLWTVRNLDAAQACLSTKWPSIVVLGRI